MPRASFTAALAFLLSSAFAPLHLQAQTNNLVAVEEDWELVVGEPDPEIVAPQVTCIMSPNSNYLDTYWSLEINHLTAPSFSPGGLHMHRWSGDWRQATFSRSDRSVITTANDTITWTQGLSVANGRLAFEVKNGSSNTWGAFGFGNFKLDMSWGVSHINFYSPNVSVANSGVGYASNRVTSLKIKRIRKTYADGQTVTDNTARVIFQQ